jgi:hypothetical protein
MKLLFNLRFDDIIKKAQEEKTRANNVVQLPQKSKIRSNQKQELRKQRQKEIFLPDKNLITRILNGSAAKFKGGT